MKVLCETCFRFLRYEPHDVTMKVVTEKCPHNCPSSDVARYTGQAKERLSDSFKQSPITRKKIGILGE